MRKSGVLGVIFVFGVVLVFVGCVQQSNQTDVKADFSENYVVTHGKTELEEESLVNTTKLVKLADRISSKSLLDSYLYPNGPVYAYGHRAKTYSDGYLQLRIKENYSIEKTTFDKLYKIINKEAKELGIQEPPVVFKYGKLPEPHQN